MFRRSMVARCVLGSFAGAIRMRVIATLCNHSNHALQRRGTIRMRANFVIQSWAVFTLAVLSGCSLSKPIETTERGREIEIIDKVDLGGLAHFKKISSIDCRRDKTQADCTAVLRNKAGELGGIAIRITEMKPDFCEKTLVGQLGSEKKCFSAKADVYGKR